ncbi:MAG: DNA polymerase III subunit delta' [Proteobacteria bacterium]|nr:DNA polymerase III subunit delta' [Pseudomonadota bacterium]MBU1641222.1 DNA polymerase III subunit delta' [Pseudomonadota bacterium]
MLTPLSAVIGQNKAKNFLLTSFTKEKMSHAYLFKGPTGVGKKMLARAFAALINCASPQNGEACSNCPSCKKFSSGNHPDLHSIEPQGAGIKIDQIRQLQKDLAYPPFEARTRVIILADIHDTMRRPEVANALLKTLEEPPPDTLLILTGDEAGGILPTILSRCQLVPFSPLSYQEVAALLAPEVEHSQALTLAAVAEGSPGRALLLHSMGLLDLRRGMIDTLTRLDPESPEAVAAVYGLAAQAADLKENLNDLLDLFATWLRDLLLLSLRNSGQLINHDLADLLEHGRHSWHHPGLLTALDHLGQARRQLLRNCNRTLVCEVLFFALLREKC